MLILETERLRLRHLVLDDLDELYALYADPVVRRYFPDGPLTYAQTREELVWFLHGHPRHPRLGLWATILKSTGQLIGRCGLLPWTIDGQEEVEVAYLLGQAYWGQGLGTEAARAIRDYGFEQLGQPRLVALIDHGNLTSQRVAVKIGMTFEKDGRDDKGPFMLYAVQRPVRDR